MGIKFFLASIFYIFQINYQIKVLIFIILYYYNFIRQIQEKFKELN